MDNIIFIEDGMQLSLLPDKLISIAKTMGWVSSRSTTERFQFCGYVQIGKEAFFSLPKTTLKRAENTNKKLIYARIIFHTIAKFAHESQSNKNLSGDQMDESDQTAMTRVLLYEKILRDWIRHGVYRETQYQDRINGHGRILWPKTISKVLPYIDKNNIPIYLQTISRLRHNNLDALISAIHISAVAKADKAIGWLYSKNEQTLLFNELSNTPDILSEVTEYEVNMLQKRLSQTFNHRDIWLLKALIRLVKYEHEFSGRVQVFGVHSFWSIWEHMCRALFSNNPTESAKLIERMPRPFYLNSDGTLCGSHSRQRPDIIKPQTSSNELLIIDAKYYDIDITTPSWGDIVKQIYYAETIRLAGISQSTSSEFILPTPFSQVMPEEIRVCDEHGTHLHSIETIKCRYHDLIEICERYLNTPSR